MERESHEPVQDLRARRLKFEENDLRERALQSGSIIMAIERKNDTITVHAKRERTGDCVLIRFEFPDNYPYTAPYWYVDTLGVHTQLPDMDWSTEDPFQGRYGPQCTLYMMCERLLEMSYVTNLQLKQYKKRDGK